MPALVSHRIGGNPERKIKSTNEEQFNNGQHFQLPKKQYLAIENDIPRSSTVILTVENAEFLIKDTRASTRSPVRDYRLSGSSIMICVLFLLVSLVGYGL